MNKQLQIKLETELEYLKLPWLRENYKSATEEAAKKQIGHLDFLASIIADEANTRQERATQRRIKQARFPVIKALDQF